MLPQAPNGKIALDNEAIVRLADGSMLISDEYGPNIYHFGADGRLISATQPPQALVPMRNGKPDFASNNPGPGETAPTPADPDTGRQNNQGPRGHVDDARRQDADRRAAVCHPPGRRRFRQDPRKHSRPRL
jgi:hypothetical protein